MPGPAVPQPLVFPDEPFRAQPPVAGPPRPLHLPPVKTFTLASGIPVYLVENHGLPLVSMDLSFEGGSAVDPADKHGLASVCMTMLTEGTERLDKLAYAEALADTASNISGYAGEEQIGITLSSLRKHLDATFAQLVETIRTPGFRASDFERLVKRRIEGVRQARTNPAAVAARLTGTVLYGRAHPFGAVVTEASLAAITLADCKSFASMYLVPGGARLFVVGDLTEPEIREYFDGPALAGWTGRPPAPHALPALSTIRDIAFVDVPGAVQATVSYLQLGPMRSEPDYFATALVGAVLGGGFTSRLNMNLREDKGYSYGARGGFSYSRSYGAFAATAQVTGHAAYQSIREMYREISALAFGEPERAVQPGELEREKRGAILGLPGRFATAQAALGQYRSLVYYGLPLDYYDSYADSVAAVTVDAAMAAATRWLMPQRAVFLVVGNGDQPVIVREAGKDVPYARGGHPLTLREALGELARGGELGLHRLVELDADGNVK